MSFNVTLFLKKGSFSFFKKSLKIVLEVTVLTRVFFFGSFLRACVKEIASIQKLDCHVRFFSPLLRSILLILEECWLLMQLCS